MYPTGTTRRFILYGESLFGKSITGIKRQLSSPRALALRTLVPRSELRAPRRVRPASVLFLRNTPGGRAAKDVIHCRTMTYQNAPVWIGCATIFCATAGI